MARVFGFPDPVDEVSARLVASGVTLMAVAYLITGWVGILAVLAYGFVARVLTGPRLSPLGLLVTRVVRPRVPAEPRWVPGPPKRFAQGMGVAMTAAALVFHLTGLTGVAFGLIAVLAACAALEAVLGFCLGCVVFGLLMRAGVVPESTCERCAAWRAPADPATDRA